MKKNMNKSSSEYFDFLAGTLSISSVITWGETDHREEAPKAAPAKSNDKYFDFLADTLSISRVVA